MKRSKPTRVSPSPFLRGQSWWARIPRLAADAIQRPLGVSGAEHRDTALDVCRFLAWLKGRRESFLLDAIADGRVNAGTAHTAYVENRLDVFVSELRDGVKDVDLEPFVARWQKELDRRKKPNVASRAKYLKQVRTFLPEDTPFRKSAFTKQAVRNWLSDLGIGQPNRYRAALSSFAEFLVFEDVIPGNPVRQVPAAAESDPRTRNLGQLDAKKLIAAIPDPRMKAFHAAMLATGMEFGAAQAIDPATVTDTSAYAAGTKKHFRRRTVTISERWTWAWEIATAVILESKDGAKPFGTIGVHASLRALRAALKATGIDTEYTQHDHRHTWAVQAVRDGLPMHAIAAQLGHRDATMVVRVYGRFQPSASDFKPRNATTGATAPTPTETVK